MRGYTVARCHRVTRAGLLAICVACLGACTRIVIQDGSGAVSVTDHFGFAAIDLSGSNQPVLLDASGTGLIAISGNVVLGYHQINAAVLPLDDCRIVIWLQPSDDVSTLEHLIGNGRSICTVDPPAN